MGVSARAPRVRRLTLRVWIVAVFALAAALVVHAAIPRYEWRTTENPTILIRIDRWTGRAQLGQFEGGRWHPRGE